MSIYPAGPSYDYQNDVRFVDEDFDITRASMPLLISAITRNELLISNKKMEWGDDVLEAVTKPITAFGTDGDGVVMVMASTTLLKAGMILGVRKATGASVTEQVTITTVDSATNITVVRDYGGTTGVTLVVGDVFFIISLPRNEGTESIQGDGYESTMNYNYTEIFDTTPQVTETAEAIRMYGNLGSAMQAATNKKLSELSRRLNSSLIYGRRVERTGSAVPGSAGGILQFAADDGTLETTGGAVSSTILNNMFETVLGNGGSSTNWAFLASFNQARKISAFNTSGTNPVVQVAQGSQSTGEMVSQFNGDIPVMGGSFQAKIFTDQNLPQDSITLVDLNRIQMRTLRRFEDRDATPAGADFIRRRILGEATWQFKNPKASMVTATGLTL